MDRIQQAYQDQQIALLGAMGHTEVEIGAKFGIHVRTVRRAKKRYREMRPRIEDVDPLDWLDMYLLRLDAQISDLALMEPGTKSTRTRTAIIYRKFKAMQEQYRVLLDTGFLPSSRIASERQELRAEHGAQLYQYLRRAAGDHGPRFAEWLGPLIEKWIEHEDQGPLARERDTFRLESVLWKDPLEPDNDHRADHRADDSQAS